MSAKFKKFFKGYFFILFSLIQFSLFGADFNLFYEKALYDPSGNEIGTYKQRIYSLSDLPANSPWRNYLSNTVDQRNLLNYAKDISRSLNSPLNLTISDRNYVSSSGKSNAGYNIDLYKHVTQYASKDSQKFVFLHELGHVANLNAYPSYYTFSGLNYGPDGLHYMDEILPNCKTAWVEGWANAFAALKNNGKVFSLSMKDDSIVGFLKVNSFEQMTRNELFVGKNLYDVINSLPSGKDKVYSAMSRTGPHNSLLDFCRGYLRLFPEDQVGLAQILDKNSQGKMSLRDLLLYVNNGSTKVNQSLYQYIQNRGKPSTGGSFKSFWARIFDFLGGLFGAKKDGAMVAQGNSDESINVDVDVEEEKAFSPESGVSSLELAPTGLQPISSNLPTVQEEYFQAFAEYNRVIYKETPDSPKVKQAFEKLRNTKFRLEQLKKGINLR